MDMAKPIIRFKGYQDDWEQRKLGDVAQEFKSGTSLKADEIDITGDYPVYGGNGLRGYTSTYNHDGEYALIGRQGALCGNMNYSVGKAYFTEHAVVVKADENNDTMFLYYMLDTMNLGQYSDQSAQPGLAVNKLVKLENWFPTKEEQQRIGWYFSNLDHLITLHQRKCDETKRLKKYMLQKMFPQNGEKVPEIRFSGFTDDWEQRKFGDVGSVAMCKRIFKEQTSDEGEVPFYKIGTFGGVPDAFISRELFDEYKAKYPYPNKGDILISASGSIGRTVEFTGKNEYFQDSNIVWLKHGNEIDNSFLKVLYSVIEWSCEGSTIKRLYNDNFLKTEFMLPQIDEQKKIGTYFSTIDYLITLHQRELENLQNIKKFMLEKMFV